MLTIGYGDFSPQTYLGRIVAVLAALWGTFIIALLVVSLTNSSEFSYQELKSFNEIKRFSQYQEIKAKAADAIKFALKMRTFLKKNAYASARQKSLIVNKFKKSLLQFRLVKRYESAKEQDMPIQVILQKLQEKNNQGLESIKKEIRNFENLVHRCEQVSKEQDIIDEKLIELYKINEKILRMLKYYDEKGIDIKRYII